MSSLGECVRRFRKAYSVELRLLTFHWSYPLLHVLLLALLLVLARNWDEGRTALGTLETIQGRLAIGLISLVGLFAAGLGATRAERANVAELEWTFPTGVEVTLARWLAGVTALLAFLIAPLVVAARQGPASSLVAGLPIYVGETALTIAFVTAGGWLLVTCIDLGRWSYPLLAAGWLGFLLGPTMLIRSFPYLSLLNFMRQGMMSYHSELWRRVAYGDAFRWFNLFYAGLGLFFVGLLIWREVLQRFRRRAAPASAIVLGGLALAVFAGFHYISPITTALLGESTTAYPPPPALPVKELQIERYDLILDLGPGHRADFEAMLTVRNAGDASLDRFDLELHPSLEITEADVSFDQDGNRVHLELAEPLAPNERRSVRLHYAGPIWETQLDRGILIAQAFIHPRGVRLSPIVAWYPRRFEEGSSSEASEPFSFHVRLEGHGDLRFGANIPAAEANVFESEDATWIYLVGSPFLVKEHVADVTLITARDGLPQVRSMISIYTDALAHLQRFMPDVPVEGLTAMVLEPGSLPRGTPPSDRRAVIVIGRDVLYSLHRVDAYDFPMVWDALLYDLWRLGGSAIEDPLPWQVRETAVFIWMHHGCGGDAACIADEISTRGWALGEREDYMPRILLDLYRREGQEAIVNVLRQFRLRSEEFAGMSRDELLAWLREVGDAQ